MYNSASKSWHPLGLCNAISKLAIILLGSSITGCAINQPALAHTVTNDSGASKAPSNAYYYHSDGCTLALPNNKNTSIAEFLESVESICLEAFATGAPGLDSLGRSYYLPFDGVSAPSQRLLLFTHRYLDNVRDDDGAFSVANVRSAKHSYKLPAQIAFTEDPEVVGDITGKVTKVTKQSDLHVSAEYSAQVEAGLGGVSGSASASLAASLDIKKGTQTFLRTVEIPYFELYLEYPAIRNFDLLKHGSELITESDFPGRGMAECTKSLRQAQDEDSISPAQQAEFDECERLVLEQYRTFFTTFGTHYVERVTLGGTALVSAKLRNKDFAALAEAAFSAKTEIMFAGGETSAELTADLNEAINSMTFSAKGVGGHADRLAALSSFDNEQYNAWLASVPEAPALIRRQYRPIWELVRDTRKQDELKDAHGRLRIMRIPDEGVSPMVFGFDSGTEDWTATPGWSTMATNRVIHWRLGTDGTLHWPDDDSAGRTTYFRAPVIMRGDWSDLYGGSLRYHIDTNRDERDKEAKYNREEFFDVILRVGVDKYLSYRIKFWPDKDGGHELNVPLSFEQKGKNGWFATGGSWGEEKLDEERMVAAFKKIEDVLIRAEYVKGREKVHLSEVELSGPH